MPAPSDSIDFTKAFMLELNPFDYYKMSKEDIKKVADLDVSVHPCPDSKWIPSGQGILIPMQPIRDYLGVV